MIQKIISFFEASLMIPIVCFVFQVVSALFGGLAKWQVHPIAAVFLGTLGSSFFTLIVNYVIGICLFVPYYLWLEKRKLNTRQNTILSGVVIGGLPFLIFFALTDSDKDFLFLSCMFAVVCGGVVSARFWHLENVES